MLFCEKQTVNHTSMTIFRLIIIFVIFFFILLSFKDVFAVQVKVTFSPSLDSRAVGHNIYYGTTSSFSNKVDIGTATSVLISNLEESTTYYFAATAYDSNRKESPFSDIVPYYIPQQSQPRDDEPSQPSDDGPTQPSDDGPTQPDDNAGASGFMEDFENYRSGSNPPNWLDTAARNSMIEDSSLFRVFEINNNMVFGTRSTLLNIHSHHIKSYIDDLSSFEYSGRMMMTNPNGGIGVTFLSHYPFSDTYYRLRCTRNNSSFHIAPHPHGSSNVYGIIDTGIIPEPNRWYRFRIRVENMGYRNEILAKVWQEGSSEPSRWQVEAYDNSPERLVSGTIGVWSGHFGAKYWDDLILLVD